MCFGVTSISNVTGLPFLFLFLGDLLSMLFNCCRLVTITQLCGPHASVGSTLHITYPNTLPCLCFSTPEFCHCLNHVCGVNAHSSFLYRAWHMALAYCELYGEGISYLRALRLIFFMLLTP